jgi:hypothetical protein
MGIHRCEALRYLRVLSSCSLLPPLQIREASWDLPGKILDPFDNRKSVTRRFPIIKLAVCDSVPLLMHGMGILIHLLTMPGSRNRRMSAQIPCGATAAWSGNIQTGTPRPLKVENDVRDSSCPFDRRARGLLSQVPGIRWRLRRILALRYGWTDHGGRSGLRLQLIF